jgi:integrase
MVKRDVKGIAKVTAKGRTYWYAWRGGSRLRGEYGSPEFWASYDEAIRARQIPEPGKFRALVTLYRGSADYQKLAPTTRLHWGPWLDRIGKYFGVLSIAQFERPEKIRPLIRQWRNKYANTPRTADMGMQVLSVVLSHAVELGKIAGNPCIGIKSLYTSDRSDIIWTAADIAGIKQVCSPEIAHAIDLAAATGLRRGDLLRLCWAHIGAEAIEITTSKSNHKRPAIIPLYNGLREVLARIPKRSPTVLTNSKGRPWSNDGFGTSFNRAKISAGLTNLHFHDLRGTAATRFYLADLTERAVAEIMGWEEASVAKIIRKYVARSAATRAAIAQLNRKD